MLNFTKNLTDDTLIGLFGDINNDSILLLEDIDAYFIDRKAQDVNVSFSVLINCLDGVLSKGEGLIIFITANNPDRLDPALLRPGRIDKIIKFISDLYSIIGPKKIADQVINTLKEYNPTQLRNDIKDNKIKLFYLHVSEVLQSHMLLLKNE